MHVEAVVELKLTELGMQVFEKEAKSLEGLQHQSRLSELLAAIAVQIAFQGGELRLKDREDRPLLRLSVAVAPEATK